MNVETGRNLFDILDILVFTSGIRLKTFFSTTKEMKMPEKLTKCTCKRCQTCSKKAQDRCVSWQPKNVFFLENIRAVDPRIWKIRHVFENWHVQGRNQIFLEGVFIAPTQLFSCEYCEIFQNVYFEEHLRTAASGRMFLRETAVLFVSQIWRKQPRFFMK